VLRWLSLRIGRLNGKRNDMAYTKQEKEVIRILKLHKGSYVVQSYSASRQRIVNSLVHEMAYLYRSVMVGLVKKGVLYRDENQRRCPINDRGMYKVSQEVLNS